MLVSAQCLTNRRCRRPVQPSLYPSLSTSRNHLQTGCVPSHPPKNLSVNSIFDHIPPDRETLEELTLNSTSICQFEMVKGIRDHNHPVCEGLSCVKRICRFVFYNDRISRVKPRFSLPELTTIASAPKSHLMTRSARARDELALLRTTDSGDHYPHKGLRYYVSAEPPSSKAISDA